ncbi:tetratricopeptide-like helical domain-containing protein [Artemisia annua]|uniref:Tetratricopeptide-like helical domain-containing protein n=1 Tax=Artemisia annua TaxID=35608 RepID=A0A2U1KEC6_ARTAN|nr:tetratricopeptide-like helical domain-containing protein [Artemisia annua]
MCAFGAPVSDYTANLVIKSYHYMDHIEQGFAVLGYCFKRGVVLQVRTYNSLLEWLCLKGKTHEAERLFKIIFTKNQLSCEPNIVTYHNMIQGLCRIGNNFTAVGLLRLMDARPGTCKPNFDAYYTNTLICSFCKDKMIDDASMLFKEMVSNKNITPDVNTYNSFIYAFSKLGRWDEVTRMLKQMKDQNIVLGRMTFHIIVDALCKQGMVKEATDAIDIMVDNCNIYLDIVIFNSLIDGYALLGDMTEAHNIFDLLSHRGVRPNIDTYNKLLFGYYNNFMVDDARYFHDYMVAKQLENNKVRYFHYYMVDVHLEITNKVTHCICILGHCLNKTRQHSPAGSILTELEEKYRDFLKGDDGCAFNDSFTLFQFMDDNKLNSHIDVYNILIDRAIKCLDFDTARHLFHDLIVKGLKPDVKTYKLMNSCYCQPGLLKDAKQLLHKMEKMLIV